MGEAAPRPCVPRSVRACGSWSIVVTVWRRDGTGEPETLPWRCNSWRCPRCRRKVALVDYARLAAAVASRPRWLYVVLTLPPEARSLALWERYRLGRGLWRDRLRKRLRRAYGPLAFLQTWEQHRDGTPHVNLVLEGRGLAGRMAALEGAGSRRRAHPIRGELMRAARESGFGRIGWVQPVGLEDDDRRGLAAYLVKLWSTVGGAQGFSKSARLAAELACADAKDQAPVCAPQGFRRFSSSRGLLPPRERSSSEWTGRARRWNGAEWTWADVATAEAHAERQSILAVDALERLNAAGVPLPESALRAGRELNRAVTAEIRRRRAAREAARARADERVSRLRDQGQPAGVAAPPGEVQGRPG